MQRLKQLDHMSVLRVIREQGDRPMRTYSIYLGDELRRQSYDFSPEILLRRLRDLEKCGLVQTDNLRRGFYGINWRITPAGLKRLNEVEGVAT